MFERYDQPVIPTRAFAVRVARQVMWAGLFLGVSLAGGVLGYAVLGHLAPVDAFLNAAMILGGMGPVDTLHDDGAKIFAGLYAIYCGVVFVVVAGLILAPFLHRVMHRLHLDASDDGTSDDATATDKPA